MKYDTKISIIGYVLLAVLFCGFVYGSYWVAKTVSYNIFYEDMVIETVKEQVKESCIQN